MSAFSDIANAYLAEMYDRNVLWILKKHPELGKIQPDPEIDSHRVQKTFETNFVSFRLLLFHERFLRLLGRPPNMSLHQVSRAFDERYLELFFFVWLM